MTEQKSSALVEKLARLFGLDRAVAYTLLGRGWSIIAGPLNLLFLARFLSPKEQGFFYTFSGLLSLQVFLELGLGVVVFQFAAHEKAALEWTPQRTLQGDSEARHRLADLLRRSLQWYGTVALLAAVILLPVGLIFFGRHGSENADVAWRLPWTAIALISASTVLLTPCLAILEGSGQVAPVALMRTGQGVAGSLCSWMAFALGWGLYAAPVAPLVGFLWAFFWLRKYRGFFQDLLRYRREQGNSTLNWRGEVWPFQWRMAVAAISAYFIFLFFNPVLFEFQGAIAAGQMGMSLSIITAISLTAGAWINTKMSPFGVLIARRDWKALDDLFFPTMWRSIALFIAGSIAFWLTVWELRRIGHSLAQRLLEPLPLAFLIGATLAAHATGALSAYLRAHKREPFLYLSVAMAFLMATSTYFLGKYFGALGMSIGYFVISTATFVLATWIFVRSRQLWHGVETERSASENIAFARSVETPT